MLPPDADREAVLLLFELFERPADLEVVFDDPDFDESEGRDLEAVDAFDREEPAEEDVFDREDDVEAFDFEAPPDLEEALPDRVELPVDRLVFVPERFEVDDPPDFELEALEPPVDRLADERPVPDFVDDDLPDPAELLAREDPLDDPVLVEPAFLVVDLEPEEDDLVDDDLDPEDFFEDDELFDPEDFLVAAITLIPRSSFIKASAAI